MLQQNDARNPAGDRRGVIVYSIQEIANHIYSQGYRLRFPEITDNFFSLPYNMYKDISFLLRKKKPT